MKKNLELQSFVFLCALAASVFQPYQSAFFKFSKNLSSSQIGLIISFTSLSGIIFSSIFARLSDSKSSRLNFLYASISSAIIGYSFLTYLTGFYLIFIIYILLIGLSSMTTAQMFAYAKDILQETKNTNSYLITLRAIVSFAWIFGPLLASILIKLYSYSGLLLGTILIYLLCIIALASLPKKLNGCIKTIKKEQEKCPKTELLCSFFIFTLLETVNNIANINFPLYMINILKFDTKYVGFATAISATLEIPCMLFFAFCQKKNTYTGKFIPIGIFSCILFFLLEHIIQNVYIFITVYSLKAFFNATYKGLGIPYFQNLLPANQTGFSTTLFTNTTRVGSLLGGVIIGSIGGYKNDFFSISILLCIFSFMIYFTQFFLCTKRVENNEKKSKSFCNNTGFQ